MDNYALVTIEELDTQGKIWRSESGHMVRANLEVSLRAIRAGYDMSRTRIKVDGQVVAEQVPITLRLAPDLISFAAGINDTLRRRFKTAIVPGENPHLVQLKRELAEYFDGARKDFTVPLEYPGTEFQQKVWNALLEIPYGVVDKIAKLIPEGPGQTLAECLKPGGELKQAYDADPVAREIVDLAKPLEGLVRQDSIHAAGVVIAPALTMASSVDPGSAGFWNNAKDP